MTPQQDSTDFSGKPERTSIWGLMTWRTLAAESRKLDGEWRCYHVANHQLNDNKIIYWVAGRVIRVGSVQQNLLGTSTNFQPLCCEKKTRTFGRRPFSTRCCYMQRNSLCPRRNDKITWVCISPSGPEACSSVFFFPSSFFQHPFSSTVVTCISHPQVFLNEEQLMLTRRPQFHNF